MQAGHEIPVKVMTNNIKQFYNITYNTGKTVTVIEFMDGSENHFVNDIDEVEKLINS